MQKGLLDPLLSLFKAKPQVTANTVTPITQNQFRDRVSAAMIPVQDLSRDHAIHRAQMQIGVLKRQLNQKGKKLSDKEKSETSKKIKALERRIENIEKLKSNSKESRAIASLESEIANNRQANANKIARLEAEIANNTQASANNIASLETEIRRNKTSPNKQMNTNAKVALLTEDITREEKELQRLLSKDKPIQKKNADKIAETEYKIQKFTKERELLQPANTKKLERNVIRAKGHLNQTERNLKINKGSSTNVENAKAKLKAAQNKLRNSKPLTNLLNTTLQEELAALPNKPNGSPPILSRYIEPNQPKRLTSKGNDTFVSPPKNAVPRPIRPKRLTSKGPNTFVAPPKNAVPRPRRPKRVSPVKNPLQLETNMSDVVNAHPTIVGVFNSPSPSVSNLDPNMSGVGATLVNRPSPSVSNSDQLKRDYLASRAKLAEAEAKLSGVMGSYIKNKEDYLVASIKFLLLQKKYVESGGNANFAAFTDPNQLDGSPLAGPLNRRMSLNTPEFPLAGPLNRRMSGNHPQNNSGNEISTNSPTTFKRPSINWFTGARNFFSKKAANFKESRKRISNARTTQKKEAANRAAEAKREKDAKAAQLAAVATSEKDARAAQLADAKRLAFQLAKNAAAEKDARKAKSAQEKAARNAERARAIASRKGNPAKSGTAHVIGQGALAPPMGSGVNFFSMFS